MYDMSFMCITNVPDNAILAQEAGVDIIFVDLEINGKELRQGHLDTVISKHSIDDVSKIRNVIDESKLLVRVNPIYKGSKAEIDKVISFGADIVMLPLFKSAHEVKEFISIVNGRAEICLLLETKEAVESIHQIIKMKDEIDYIHIGLNDLHLSYGLNFMFEPLANGVVEDLAKIFNDNNIKFGIGGIAELGRGSLSSEIILAEHVRLNSTMVILSRSFHDFGLRDNMIKSYGEKVTSIRDYLESIKHKPISFFEDNTEKLVAVCKKISHMEV